MKLGCPITCQVTGSAEKGQKSSHVKGQCKHACNDVHKKQTPFESNAINHQTNEISESVM